MGWRRKQNRADSIGEEGEKEEEERIVVNRGDRAELSVSCEEGGGGARFRSVK